MTRILFIGTTIEAIRPKINCFTLIYYYYCLHLLTASQLFDMIVGEILRLTFLNRAND